MKNSIKTIAMWLIILVIAIVVVTSILENSDNKLAYSELVAKIEAGEVQEIEIEADGTKATVTLKNENLPKTVNIPSMDNLMEVASDSMKAGTITIIEKSESFFVVLLSLLTPFGILIIFLLFWFFLMAGNQGGAGSKTMTFGKSKAKVINPQDKARVTFKDVAGVDEEKEELEEIVEFLKNPKKFTDMGARIPKGVLLVGQPGTGKTLLAKAVAGEAGVPFFIISGSDFVEMFVGVGASRVRDLFEEAKKKAPCIIFIDEIDAVGRQRGAGLGGGHDEREQTLNQLLVEMDGFAENEGVIVLAATNRPEMLDKALLRPGRFDRQITVQIPDLRGREEILKIHAKEKKFAEDVNLKNIAEDTAGLTGAELANILNEAAIIATVNNHTAIEEQDIEEAVKKVTVGLQKVSRVYSEKDKKITAYHEAGHAIVSRYLPTQENVKEISIIPRGMAGGYTMYKSNEDKNYIEKTELEERLVALMGGRAAEYIIFHDISTGAANDIEVATEIAKNMVTVYGMSSLVGNISINTEKDPYELQILGEKFGDAIGAEIKLLLDGAYIKAQSIIKEHMEQLEIIAQTLLKKETIGEEEFKNILKEE